MGTSSSNGGPRPHSSLLPTWYNDLPALPLPGGGDGLPPDGDGDGQPDGTPQSQPDQQDGAPAGTPPIGGAGKWNLAKAAVTRSARGTQGSSVRKAAGKYMKTAGGASSAARAARSGVGPAARFGSFFGAVGRAGFDGALQEFGLTDCIGQPTEYVLAKLVDRLAPIGTTQDEAIAREALITALDSLYTAALDNDGDALENLSEFSVRDAVLEYIGSFIFTKWLHELGAAIERNTVSEREAVQLEGEMKTFVREEVRTGLEGRELGQLDPNSPLIQQVIASVYEMAYATLEE